jgi:hypothetical protein
MSTAPQSEPTTRSVSVTDDSIIARLADGHVISVPLAWSWCLSQATPKQREHCAPLWPLWLTLYRTCGNMPAADHSFFTAVPVGIVGFQRKASAEADEMIGGKGITFELRPFLHRHISTLGCLGIATPFWRLAQDLLRGSWQHQRSVPPIACCSRRWSA